MIIHYQNSRGIEQFIRDVIHLQNINNDTWEAVMNNGRSLTLRTAGIEGIYHNQSLSDSAYPDGYADPRKIPINGTPKGN